MSFIGTTPRYSGQFTTGTDLVSLRITRNDTGAAIALGGRRSMFEANEKKTVIAPDCIDNGGRVDHVVIPGGYHGTIQVNRFNGDFDSFMKLFDANFYAGQGQVYATIVEQINNGFDQSSTVNTYTQVVFTQPKSGDYSRTKETMVTIEFDAQERI